MKDAKITVERGLTEKERGIRRSAQQPLKIRQARLQLLKQISLDGFELLSDGEVDRRVQRPPRFRGLRPASRSVPRLSMQIAEQLALQRARCRWLYYVFT